MYALVKQSENVKTYSELSIHVSAATANLRFFAIFYEQRNGFFLDNIDKDECKIQQPRIEVELNCWLPTPLCLR